MDYGNESFIDCRLTMSNSPTFSILVPAYNHAQYLPQTLDSLLAQTDPDWEALVVDDGSSDQTPEVLQAYALQDTRFRIFRKPNGGTASALNEGLRHACGQWICWLSSDDLFDPHKLEIHRTWMKKYPECQFFFTQAWQLIDATGEYQELSSFMYRNPAREWQVIEMLYLPYIYGNSVCIKRDAWLRVGMFDETLRYGQDYDMWLRLMSVYPMIQIPEHTCIARVHPAQGTRQFYLAGPYDSAKSAIQFLNSHDFSQLFPLVDLQDLQAAFQAIQLALKVAFDPQSFLYFLGPHVALLLRILEWAWSVPELTTASQIHEYITETAITMSQKYVGTVFGFYGKIIAAVTTNYQRTFTYSEISPNWVATMHYWRLYAAHHEEKASLRRYLQEVARMELPAEMPGLPETVREIVMVYPGSSQLKITTPVKYGAQRAAFEITKHITKVGGLAILIGIDDIAFGVHEGVVFLGVADEEELNIMLKRLAPIDTLIERSQFDPQSFENALHAMIYHHDHGPLRSHGQGEESEMSRWNLHIACVSHHSKQEQLQIGIAEQRVHIVPNGVDQKVFHPDPNVLRNERELMFAGNIVHYKGFDIALRAFQKIKASIPETEFYAYGNVYSWKYYQHYFSQEWLDEDGFPQWEIICRDVPGFHYCGEIPQAQLAQAFQRHSMLLVPSRIAETFGMTSIEAQACGCIPVLPRRGGFIETMKEGNTGYLYDHDEPESLAELILALWAKNCPTQEQRVAAQERIRESFSWEQSSAVFLEHINALPRLKDQDKVTFLTHYCPRVQRFMLKGWKYFRSKAHNVMFRYTQRSSPK